MRRVAFLLIIGLAGAGILISLGVWQVKRLAWKQGILEQIETRIAANPVAIPTSLSPDQNKYLPVRATGTLGPGALRVLVSIKHVGPGYRIISPLELTQSGRVILLDRGFIAIDQALPEAPPTPIEVTGNLHWPQEIDSYTPEPDLATNTWFARDVPAMAAALGTEPVLLVARTSSQTDPRVTPLPVDTSTIPNDHLQYAVTWFSLAVIWLAMTLLFLWRTRAQHES